MTITPSCVVTDYSPPPHVPPYPPVVTVSAGTINGYYNSSPNFLLLNHELELCPNVAGEHTIHAEYYGYDGNEYVYCDITKTFMVFDTEINDFEIIAEGNPCPLVPVILNNNPAYGVPCCTNNIEFEYTTDFPDAIISTFWAFHTEADYLSSGFDYSQSNWYNSPSGQVSITTLINNLFINCVDTFYLSLFKEYECGLDTITKAFVLLPPIIDFTASIACVNNNTYFEGSIDQNCAQSWSWNFNDGTLGSGQSISHSYSNTGIYNVTLTVIDYCGNVITIQKQIEIYEGPVVNASLNVSHACYNEITATVNDPNPNYTYDWIVHPSLGVWFQESGTNSAQNMTEVTLMITSNYLLQTPSILTLTVTDNVTGCSKDTILEFFPCCADNGDFFFVDHEFDNETLTFINKVIVFNGTNYIKNSSSIAFLDHCQIYFGANAKLIVTDNSSLHIEESQITSCNKYMWDGIYAFNNSSSVTAIGNNPVSNAKNAFVSQYDGRISISGNTFRNNHTSVKVEYCSNSSVDIYSNTFTSNYLMPPYLGQKAFSGIHLIETVTIPIGPGNTFNTMNNGIYCFNADANIFNNSFDNIQNFSQFRVKGNSNAAIYAEGFKNKDSKFILVGGDYLKYNTFNNCVTGVSVNNNYNAYISHNNFTNCLRGTAIQLAYMQSGNNAIISRNNITDYRLGIFGYRNSKALVFINFNEITGSQNNNNLTTGIRITGDLLKMEKYVIEDNTINYPTTGISLLNLYYPKVSRNSVIALKPTFPPINKGIPKGIHLQKCYKAHISNNYIAGQNVPNEPSTMGIQFENSAKSFISCNYITHVGGCIRATNPCLSSQVTVNTFINAFEGISLSVNGQIGQQGSLSYPTDNLWLPTAQDWYNNNRWPHYTWNSDGGLSPIYVRNGTITDPIDNPNARFNGTVFTIVNGAYNPAITECNFIIPKSQIELMELKQLIEELVDFQIYDEETGEIIKRELLSILPGDSLAMTDDEIIAFLQNMQNEPKGQSELVQQLIEQEEYALAEITNLGIVPATVIEEIERSVRQAQISSITSYTISDNDIEYLDSIAMLCPFTHGAGVYIARALMAYIDQLKEYINDCELDQTFSVRNSELHVTKKHTLTISPNPASDFLNYEIKGNTEDLKGNIEVTDLTGRTLKAFNVNVLTKNALDVSWLNNGCYLFKLTLLPGETLIEKFCVIK